MYLVAGDLAGAGPTENREVFGFPACTHQSAFMLTSRGWWLISGLSVITILAFLIPGRSWVVRQSEPIAAMACVCLTLLLWLLGEWILFVVRAHVLHRRLKVQREISDGSRIVDNLWAGRNFHVRVTVTLGGSWRIPYVSLIDRLPFSVTRSGQGASWFEGTLEAGEPLIMEYDVRCTHPGRVRFEGLQVRIADLHGFFHSSYFVRDPLELRVLPPLVDAEGIIATMKRHNILPPPGIHRQRRPGSGTELLDLRDYLPGDPPKTIAWKASARRDRLITKEFENEVPVRTTLFVDTSQGVRLGPPGRNQLTALVEIASAVAQASAAVRDLTGLCLFDETRATTVRPGRGQRHVIQLINTLADAAGLRATNTQAEVNSLLPLACVLAEEVYPDWMNRSINTIPVWLPWLSPKPGYTYRTPTWKDRINGWMPFLVGFMGLGGLFFSWVGILDLLMGSRRNIMLLGLLLGPIMLVGMLILGLMLNVQRRLAVYRWRKRLAAVLSVRYQLEPGGLSLLMEDDLLLMHFLHRFLIDHHVPFQPPMFTRRGRYLFASKSKVDVIAAELLRSVRRGHDNELFVIMADLMELNQDLEPFLRAVKVAVARHHQVLFVCPWPVGVPYPAAEQDQERGRLPRRSVPLFTVEQMNDQATQRLHAAVHDLRLRLARVGVRMLCTEPGESTRLILDKIERLRMASIRA